MDIDHFSGYITIFSGKYPLVNTQKTMENHHTFSMGKSLLRLTGPKIPGDRRLFTPLKYTMEWKSVGIMKFPCFLEETPSEIHIDSRMRQMTLKNLPVLTVPLLSELNNYQFLSG